ncbi:MAG: CoA-binding protein, partial [Sulfolobus sp.]|nr:CoA-binding protein [Sulfolobus sp.]
MLESLFKPKIIAVVGASRDRNKVGNVILRNLLATYSGKIIPINNKAESVEGLRAYKSLKEVQGQVDLAVISIPRNNVPEVMEDAGEANVKAAIVITSGFRELDELGAKLEEQLVSIAKKYGIRFLGPNTFGIITPSFNSTFAFSDVKKGNIALVVQSGGVGVYMLNWAQKSRLGISYFVSLGNQADLKETEIIQYLADDPETRAIFSYIEGIQDGDKFLEVLPEITKKKPVVFLKGGISTHGSAAAKTHTGSIAGSYELFKAAVRAVGAILVDDLSDFLDLARLIASDEPIREDVLVVTNSGGHGVLTSDAIDKYGLRAIELPDNITQELQKVLPPQSFPRNPLDLSGDATSIRYDQALKAIQDLDCTKIVIVQSLPMVSCTEVARVIMNYKGSGVVGV